MRRAVLAIVAAAAVTASCSGSPSPTPSEPPATSAAATPEASASPAETPTASSSASGTSITPPSNCLSGRYRLARFVGAKSNTYGTGEGGDVTVTFDAGKYLMAGAGKDPIKVTLAGQSAPLTVDGTVEGVYSGTGDQVSFTRGKSVGSATVSAGGAKRTLTMAQVANVLAPSGDGKLSCTPTQLTITLDDVRLELEK